MHRTALRLLETFRSLSLSLAGSLFNQLIEKPKMERKECNGGGGGGSGDGGEKETRAARTRVLEKCISQNKKKEEGLGGALWHDSF